MDYTVKSVKGKRVVAFACPRCNFALESPLEEAGGRYPCPTCQHELIVPGVRELKKLRAEEATNAEEKSRMAAKRASEEQAREAQRAREAQHALDELARSRAEREAAEARARESKRIERASGKPSVSGTTFAVTLLFVALAVVGLIYLSMVRPLQRKLSDLTNTVNHNAETANRTADGLTSLTNTVNHNAETANRTTAALAHDLAETDRIAQNANRHAHSHSRF